MPELAPLIMILVGAFSLFGGLLGWSMLLNHTQARLLTRLVGPTGTRAFYVVAGFLVSSLGVGLLVTGS